MRAVFRIAAGTLLAASGLFGAIAQQAGEPSSGDRATSVRVDVVLSDFWTRHVGALNRIEQNKEERFRQYRLDEEMPARSVFRMNRSRLAGTEWANERLIDKVENYTLTNLVTRLVQDNLARAGIEPDGHIRVKLKRMNLQNADLAVLNGATTWAKGRFEVIGPDGKVTVSKKVSTNFVRQPSIDPAYDGPKYAFWRFDEDQRVGPLMSAFVEDGLEKLYPEAKDQIHGPVMITPVLPSPTRTM